MDITCNCPNRLAFDSVRRFKEQTKTFIEAHRGVHRLAPENTLKAFKIAIEMRLDSIELDVWLTKDNVPVVIHGSEEDGDISGTTTGSGSINSLTLRELNAFRTIHEDEDIPTLEEVFILCKDKIFINIELKDKQHSICFKETLDLLHKYDMKNQVALSSFHHHYWNEVINHSHGNNLEFGFLYDYEDLNKVIEFKVPNSTININCKEITEELVKKAHENQIAVLCWFSMKDEENEEIILNLIRWGVDVICCNNPSQALDVRERYINYLF